jgi:hypothetical protein
MMWAAHIPGLPLALLRFGEVEDGYASMRVVGAQAHMTLTKNATLGQTVWLGLHEVAHSLNVDATEPECDRFASIWADTWRPAVAAYVEGDPGPMRELKAALAWGRRQAEQRKAQEDARRFAAICQKHAVIGIDWRPGTCAPWVEFAPTATKALDPEVEAEIARLFPYGIKDAEMLAFVRSVLTRRLKFIAWLADLTRSGLLPA